MRLASGHLAAQAVYVFVALGIPDILRASPLSFGELARKTNTNEDALRRLLKFLATVDVVHTDEDGRVNLTRVGREYCDGPVAVVRSHVLLVGSSCYWAAIGAMRVAIETGGVAFESAFGQQLFDYLSAHPEERRQFDVAMEVSSWLGDAYILDAYDFGALGTVVDVGGGTGRLLTSILKKYSSLTGTLFDSPSALRNLKVDPSVSERMQVTEGSFFHEVPPGANAYILRRILHDWNDKHALAILEKVRHAMKPGARLLIIEQAAPGEGQSHNTWTALDMLMMLLAGGKERTEGEFQALLEQAGFGLVRTVRTRANLWLLEARPA